jgi:hypothetical protein
MKKYICPKCKREYWGIYRKKTVTEYKIIDNTENKGVKLYKGNWKTEEVVESKILGMRCMACGYETDGGDIEGCSGVRIENKNVVFITDFWNKLGR